MSTVSGMNPAQEHLPIGVGDARGSADSRDALLQDATFCVVDLETTGRGAAAITEIGAVKVRGGSVLGEFQTLVDPGVRIDPAVVRLTGITNEMVASAPPLAAVFGSFLEFSSGCVMVAHNAAFDMGFLRRACIDLQYRWPQPPVLDTLKLARQVLSPGEVRNHRLGTLAALVGSPTRPTHRALDDARATVDVLHHLIERLGNRGVYSVTELAEHQRRVPEQRRRKAGLAKDVPSAPGVYRFERGAGDDREVLYVGRSVDLRRRVSSYFTASENRRRIDEMIRAAERVETTVCSTPLEAEVTELRLIDAHQPRYNRRSKQPRRGHWVKLTDEPFPRLSIVRQVRDDATYLGPFSRAMADTVAEALHDAFPVRQCTQRLSPRTPSSPCALKELGRCVAPCDGTVDAASYSGVVERVRTAMNGDGRALEAALHSHMVEHSEAERFEAAATDRDRIQQWREALIRHHRVATVAACPEIRACAPVSHGWAPDGWEVHVIRHGRLVGATVARRGEYPPEVAEHTAALSTDVAPPVGPLPAGTVEEARQVAGWLERPGVRLLYVEGDLQWPLHLQGADLHRAQ